MTKVLSWTDRIDGRALSRNAPGIAPHEFPPSAFSASPARACHHCGARMQVQTFAGVRNDQISTLEFRQISSRRHHGNEEGNQENRAKRKDGVHREERAQEGSGQENRQSWASRKDRDEEGRDEQADNRTQDRHQEDARKKERRAEKSRQVGNHRHRSRKGGQQAVPGKESRHEAGRKADSEDKIDRAQGGPTQAGRKEIRSDEKIARQEDFQTRVQPQ
ncbi:MAG: hypothetical protein IPH43_06270 [Xanthomonadales bacterium]|uniref:hypothetical protein n=1 Tax=Dokdonella sp. TaxID=2291710 RepID=UPI0031C86937|nr:hypothetical protein [Xanthomonadales bacterium]